MAMLNPTIIKTCLYTIRGFDNEGRAEYGLNLIEWGPPGIGKTKIKQKLARLLDFDCFRGISAGNKQPVEFAGVMFPREHYYECMPPKWAYDLNQARRAWLFVDEWGDCARATQAALQDMTTEMRCGDLNFGPHVRISGAGNPTGISTNARDLSAPNANRHGHFDVDYEEEDIEKWRLWYISDGGDSWKVDPIDGDALEKEVEAAWPTEYPRARGEISAFVGSLRKDVLMNIPDKDQPEHSRGFPTPRSVENAGRALAGARIHGLDETELDALLGSFVGETWVESFTDWRRENTLPPFEKVLSGEIDWSYNASRPDVNMAVMDGCAGMVVGTPDKKVKTERASRMWDLIEEVAKHSPDEAWTAMDTMATHGLSTFPKARKVLREFRPMMETIKGIERQSA